MDTSVVLYDPDCFSKFGDNVVIIPSIVLEELNKIKGENTERGYMARQSSKQIEEMSFTGKLCEGVKMGQTVFKVSHNIYNNTLSQNLLEKNNDFYIIACAINNQAILISRDRMMRIIASDFVKVQDYHADKVQSNDIYKGYRKVLMPGHDIDAFYKFGSMDNLLHLFPNEFVLIQDECNEQHVAIGICKGAIIKAIDFDSLFKKNKFRVCPQNTEQKMLLYLLMDDEISCVSCCGTSGKGKTLLSVDYGISNVFDKKYDKFLFTKSIIATDSREVLGYFKGEMLNKLKPHFPSLYSAIEQLFRKQLYDSGHRISVEEKIDDLINQDVLNLFSLADIRGMSVFNKVVLLDEAQNTTNHIMKSLVTRMHDNSKLIVTGDIDQIDDKNLDKYNNGLVHLIESGKNEPYIGHITMDLDNKSKRGKLSEFGSNKL